MPSCWYVRWEIAYDLGAPRMLMVSLARLRETLAALDPKFELRFIPINGIASNLKVLPLTLSRIAGSVSFACGMRKVDLGMQLKVRDRSFASLARSLAASACT